MFSNHALYLDDLQYTAGLALCWDKLKGSTLLLSFSTEHRTKRFLFASSVEVYGENRGDIEYFTWLDTVQRQRLWAGRQDTNDPDA